MNALLEWTSSWFQISACYIPAASIVDEALTKDEYGSETVQAYMSIWHETGASQPGVASLQALYTVEKLKKLKVRNGPNT